MILSEIARLRKYNGVTEEHDDEGWEWPDEEFSLGGAGSPEACHIGYGDLDEATRARMRDSTAVTHEKTYDHGSVAIAELVERPASDVRNEMLRNQAAVKQFCSSMLAKV